MSASEPDKPDVSIIVAHSKAMVLSGLASCDMTVSALRLIEQNLRRDYEFSSEALQPIVALLDDLEGGGLAALLSAIAPRGGQQNI